MTGNPSRTPDHRNDWREFETPAAAVASTVAAATGRDVTELPPLHDAVDADALDALMETGGDGTRIAFAYGGVRVTIDADGTVVVTP